MVLVSDGSLTRSGTRIVCSMILAFRALVNLSSSLIPVLARGQIISALSPPFIPFHKKESPSQRNTP